MAAQSPLCDNTVRNNADQTSSVKLGAQRYSALTSLPAEKEHIDNWQIAVSSCAHERCF